jgi:hypothetical protein
VPGNEVPIGTSALTLYPGRSESDELRVLLASCPEGQHASLKGMPI